MSTFDALFLAGCLLGALGGWRLGIIRRLAGWVGLLVGAALVSRVLPLVIETPTTPTTPDLLRRVAFIGAGALIGQSLGHLVGTRLRRLASEARLGIADSALGGLVGIGGIVVVTWMLVPAMVQIPGWSAETIRTSVVAERLARSLGEPPDVLGSVSESLGVGGLGGIVGNIGTLAAPPSAPGQQPLSDPILEQTRRSVVRLSGPACNLTQSGSGFVIAPGVVATNAHVVAGSESLTITDDSDLEIEATLRYFDPLNDIALVVAPDLERTPLTLAAPTEGAQGSVFGYPGGGPLVIEPAQVAAVTTADSGDIYERQRFVRDIIVMGTRLGPGDSGGPLVDQAGAVIAMAFAISPFDEQTAYAVPSGLVATALSQLSSEPVGSGPCRI